MKILKNKNIIITFIVSTIITIALACNYDYECGSGFPYAACDGKLNVYPGISYDNNFNLIISGKFNSTNNGPFGLPAMFSIPITSTNDTVINKLFNINGEIEEGAGANHIYRFVDYLPQSKYYYFIMNQAGAPIFSYLKQDDATLTPIINIFNTPFVIDWLESEKITVYSAYGIYRVNNIPTKKSDFENPTLLYQNQIVNGLAIDQKSKKDIYMSTYDGTFLKGSIDCVNCTQDKLVKIGSDTDAAKLTDFIQVRDMLYFSFNGGIKKFPIESSNGTSEQIVKGENVVALTEFNGIVYYVTSDGLVKSVLSDSDHSIKTIYTPSSDHQCQAAVGFNDLNGTCTGTVIWDYKGIPRCSPFKQGTNVPEICYFSHHCGNEYYTCLAGKCECLSNFYGSDCKSCDGTVSFIYNGIPTCTLSN